MEKLSGRLLEEYKVTEEIRAAVLDALDRTRELEDNEILDCIDQVLVNKCKTVHIPLSKRNEIRKAVFHSLRRLDILQDILDNPEITEIMVNGYDSVFIERAGKIEKIDKRFASRERLADVIQQMVAKVNRRVNEASPIVDSRLEDGSRVNIVLNPIAINGPIVTIRKFPEKPVSMKQLLEWGAISSEAADMLRNLVKAGYNIFVCGGTGSGKTTFLNAMSDFIPKDERIITIEDSAELQISGIANLVRLETRNATAEGEHEITIRDLIRTSLRMRPTRILVGEIRGKEALDLLQAMNTGHDGSMSTGHGNSPADMLSRIETMVLMGAVIPLQAIRAQVSSAIDILIHLGRLRDKSRRVLEITELEGLNGDEYRLNRLYHFEETGEEAGRIIGKLRGSAENLKNKGKLRAAGIGLQEKPLMLVQEDYEEK